MRESFLGTFTIIKLIGKDAVEFRITKEFSRKHPVFPVSLVKPYFQTEEDRFPSRKKNPTPPEIVEVEDSHGPLKKIINARKIRMNGKDQRQYLVRFKNQTADTNGWLRMPYQMGTFIPGDSGPLGGLKSLINDVLFWREGMSSCESKPEHKHDSQIP
ncbi:hypothetical protein O181_092388 [Austropuccinia psidii MF-1]|uniref:Chromo domain-containing protein n=1 Tax=Austropuccinia psidii MF-1 TaxID=1389203 RepID=A0A9Q3IZ64_9BASI|nr:hypothetical protein [Austropuccinia psidii MF-1]